MATGSRFAVAIHTLAVLGFLKKIGQPRVSSSQIAKSVNTHPVMIRNLLCSLKKAGLIHSKEGRDGGVSLAKIPSKISLQEIYTAVEEAPLLLTHAHPEYEKCPISKGMKRILPTLFSEIEKGVLHTLKGKTLEDVIGEV